MRPTRWTIRSAAAAIAAAMAILYLLIGLGVLDVGGTSADRQFLIVFGLLAGGAFLLGARLLVRFDRRWVWIAGVLFQVFVYWAYVDVSKSRTPPYEVWGITLRIIQLPLLAALVYLAVGVPGGRPDDWLRSDRHFAPSGGLRTLVGTRPLPPDWMSMNRMRDLLLPLGMLLLALAVGAERFLGTSDLVDFGIGLLVGLSIAASMVGVVLVATGRPVEG